MVLKGEACAEKLWGTPPDEWRQSGWKRWNVLARTQNDAPQHLAH